MSGKKKPAAPDVVFPKVMQREITDAGKLDAPPSSALPASDKAAAAMIDWLKSAQWKSPWSLENGRLRSTGKGVTRYFGVARDGTVRVRFRDDPATAISKTAPPLQITFRNGPNGGAKDHQSSYQLQVFPSIRAVSLLFLAKDTRTNVDVPEFLWRGQPFPPAAPGDAEMELELRAIGQDLSLWAGTTQVAAIRDDRAQNGGWLLIGNPGVEITALETSGITPNPGSISPQTGNALPAITHWQDVTGKMRDLARGRPDMVVTEDSITGADNTARRLMLPLASRSDYAVRVRYVNQAQVDLRVKNTGDFAFVLCQKVQTIISRVHAGQNTSQTIGPSKLHPPGFDPSREHELVVVAQGRRIRTWMDGESWAEGEDATLTEGEAGLPVAAWTTVKKVEVAELGAAAAAWQPVFTTPEDFGGDMRDVEFRDGATFIKGRTALAPLRSPEGAIRGTLRYFEADRTGSLTIRSPNGSYGNESFACTAFVSSKGTNVVIQLRDKAAGINDPQRSDFPLTPALKEGETFTMELAAEGGQVTVRVNGRDAGSVKDTWKTGDRRFGITPSNTEMTEFRDVAVQTLSGGR
jgi:hypothetical protein